jgi:hypothetical protein
MEFGDHLSICLESVGEQECLCRDGPLDGKWLAVSSPAQKRTWRSVAFSLTNRSRIFWCSSSILWRIWRNAPPWCSVQCCIISTSFHRLTLLASERFQNAFCSKQHLNCNWFPDFKRITHTSIQLKKHVLSLCYYQKHNASPIRVT